MNLKNFIFSRLFVKQLIIALVLTFVIIGGLWFYLKIFTNHGEHVVVPNVVGQTVEKAEETLDNLDIGYEIIDSVWNKDAIGGLIIEQEPEALSERKPGNKIYLKTTRFEPDEKVVNIKEGEDKKVAMIKLDNIDVDYEVKNEPNKLLAGRVIRITQGDRNIKTGMKLKPGSKVTLYVGEERLEKVSVPDLIGKTLNEAEKILLSSNLTLGFPFYEDVMTREDSLNAKVFLQSPSPSSEPSIKSGSSVDLHLSIVNLNLDDPDGEGGED